MTSSLPLVMAESRGWLEGPSPASLLPAIAVEKGDWKEKKNDAVADKAWYVCHTDSPYL